jgi:hypothetical protein
MLTITIPEAWLAGAKYPVTVDPVIGSASVGAYHYFYYIYDSEYEDSLEGWRDEGATNAEITAYLEEYKLMPSAYGDLNFNRWTTPETLQGIQKVYIHAAKIEHKDYSVLAPVIFNESGNIPDTRISGNEYGFAGSTTPGWKALTLNLQNTVAANSPLWLGMIGYRLGVSFDYGGNYFDVWGSFNQLTGISTIQNGQSIGGLLANCGMYIPQYRECLAEGDDEWIEEMRSSVQFANHNVHPKGPGRYDFKFSYYFQPASIAYTRTLTAGITLTDTRKLSETYVRKAVQTVKGTTVLKPAEGFYRKCVMNGQNNMTLKRTTAYIRKAAEQLGVALGANSRRGINRTMANQAAIPSGMSRRGDSKRSIGNTATPGTG